MSTEELRATIGELKVQALGWEREAMLARYAMDHFGIDGRVYDNKMARVGEGPSFAETQVSYSTYRSKNIPTERTARP